MTLLETLQAQPWQLSCRVQEVANRADPHMFAPNSRHFLCDLKRAVTPHTYEVYTFFYSQGSGALRMPKLPDLIYAVLGDAQIAWDCDDEWDMAAELGMVASTREEYEQLRHTYGVCRKAAQWLSDQFTRDELDRLVELFEDY